MTPLGLCSRTDHQGTRRSTMPRAYRIMLFIGNFVVTWEDDKDDNGYFETAARGVESGGPVRSLP